MKALEWIIWIFPRTKYDITRLSSKELGPSSKYGKQLLAITATPNDGQESLMVGRHSILSRRVQRRSRTLEQHNSSTALKPQRGHQSRPHDFR